VRIVGLVAKEYSTPIPMVFELPWPLFLVLLADIGQRGREQEEAYRAEQSKMNRGKRSFG